MSGAADDDDDDGGGAGGGVGRGDGESAAAEDTAPSSIVPSIHGLTGIGIPVEPIVKVEIGEEVRALMRRQQLQIA